MSFYPTFTLFRGSATTANVSQTVYTAPTGNPVLIHTVTLGTGATLAIDGKNIVAASTSFPVYELKQIVEGGKNVSIYITNTTSTVSISGSYVN